MDDYITFAECCGDTEGEKEYPSIYDCMGKVDKGAKPKIVMYLKANNLLGVAPTFETDCTNGKQIIGVYCGVRTDGQYFWDESLAYYVDKYDVCLPDDFINHILASYE